VSRSAHSHVPDDTPNEADILKTNVTSTSTIHFNNLNIRIRSNKTEPIDQGRVITEVAFLEIVEKLMTLPQTLSTKELMRLPYIADSPADGRTVFLSPFFDEKQRKFRLPIILEDKIVFVKAEPVQACYYAINKLDHSDLFLKLIDYTARYFSFDSVLRTLFGIIRDISNCSVIVERYFLYLDIFRKKKDVLIANFVSVDLEFLFGNIRSSYDSLQYLISTIWQIEKKKQIRSKFSDMIKHDGDYLARKYDLPTSLIDCYQKSKDFFDKIKKIRDDIHHLSINTDSVFCLKDGFALQKDSSPKDPITKNFDIWSPEKTKKNGLVSVLALYTYLTKSFLNDTESFSESIKESISKTPMISPNYKLFLRGPYLKHLADSDRYLKEHWIN
jgi:hypothetical protein